MAGVQPCIFFLYRRFLRSVFNRCRLFHQPVTRIREFADEKKIVVKYEEFKRITYEKRKEQKDKIRFFMSLPRRERMNEMLEHYRQRMEELEKSLSR